MDTKNLNKMDTVIENIRHHLMATPIKECSNIKAIYELTDKRDTLYEL